MATPSAASLSSLTEHIFHSHESAFLALQAAVYSQNYGISKGAATKVKKHQQYDPQGEVRRYDYYCPHGGTVKKESNRYRRTTNQDALTTKIGCEWHVKIVRQAGTGQWHISFAGKGKDLSAACDQHNHPPTLDKLGDVNYRRFWRQTHPGIVEGWVERLSLTARMSSEKIAAFLRGDLDLEQDYDGTDLPQVHDPTPPCTQFVWLKKISQVPAAPHDHILDAIDPSFAWGDQSDLPAHAGDDPPANHAIPLRVERMPVSAVDVRTIQRQLRLDRYGPFTATQLFLDQLRRNQRWHGIAYKVQRGSDGRIIRLFWTYQWCLNMWKLNPDLWIVDNTYKVSRLRAGPIEFECFADHAPSGQSFQHAVLPDHRHKRPPHQLLYGVCSNVWRERGRFCLDS